MCQSVKKIIIMSLTKSILLPDQKREAQAAVFRREHQNKQEWMPQPLEQDLGAIKK